MKRSHQLLFCLALAAGLLGLVSCKHAQTGAPASSAGPKIAKQPARKFVSGLADSAWPKFQGDARNTGQSRFVGPHTASIKWISSVGPGPSVPTSPVIGPDGTIYAGFSWVGANERESIFALDPSKGSVKWRRDFAAEESITSTPVVGSDGIIYVGSRDTNVYALNPADGSVKWSHKTGHWAGTPTIGQDGTIFVGSWDEFMYALDPRDGAEKWKHATHFGNITCPAISPDGTIYVGGTGFAVLALGSTDGSVKWRYPLSKVEKTTSPPGLKHMIISSPAVDSKRTIYVGATGSNLRDGRILSLAPDGSVKWSAKIDGTPYPCPSVSKDGTIYAATTAEKRHTVYALRSSDGSLKWKFPTGARSGTSVTIGADGILYFGCEDKRVYALQSSDGTVLWKYTTGGAVAGSPAIGSDGTVYVESVDGKVYAFGPKAKPRSGG